MVTVKITGYYEISTFMKGGQEITKASFVGGYAEEDWLIHLKKGDNFDGVISYPRPTQNELRGDSAVPLHGYNIFGRRAYYLCPRQSRRNKG